MKQMPDLVDITLSILELFDPELLPNKPWLQTLIGRDTFGILDFTTNHPIFPFAMDASRGLEENPDCFEIILNAYLCPIFGDFSLIKMSLVLCEIQSLGFIFSEELLRKSFFETKRHCLRMAISTHFTNLTSFILLLKLLPLVVELQYRSESEQFLNCFQCYPDLSREIFVPFYLDL
jgi:hypothetical protein